MSKIERESYNCQILPELKGHQLYKLTKVSDDKFNGNHPNLIDEGYITIGCINKKPTIGERFEMFNSYFISSTVTEVLGETIFKTLNSTYKLEEYNFIK